MLKRIISAVLVFTGVMMVMAINAFAYIDPSVLMYIIQAVGAVFIGAGAVVAIYWKKIKLYFKRRKENKDDSKQA